MLRRIFILWVVVGLCGWQGAAWASTLKITRMQIYFDNYRPEITVPQNQSKLTAYVELDYDGIGLLEGHWEVDGQIISQVRRHLDRSYDGSIALTSPQTPGLPTWQAGSHRLRFVLVEPSLGQPEPEALYYVTGNKIAAKPVTLSSPGPQASLKLEDALAFQWLSSKENTGYLLVFFDEPGNTIFSVYTKGTSYTIPAFALGKIFQAGQQYRWQVQGYDANFNEISASKKQRFSIAP